MGDKTEVRVWKMAELRVDQQADQAPKLVGYASVFNQLSEDLGGFREKIQPGAFSKTLQEADVRALFNHDPNMVLGRTKSGTLRMMEDPVGLRVEVDLPDTTYARDLAACMKRGDINQMSFSFETVRDAWEEDREARSVTRTVIECKLYDVSPVTYPAYPQTSASVRSIVSRFMQPEDAAPAQVDHPASEQPDAQARVGQLRRNLKLLELSLDQE